MYDIKCIPKHQAFEWSCISTGSKTHFSEFCRNNLFYRVLSWREYNDLQHIDGVKKMCNGLRVSSFPRGPQDERHYETRFSSTRFKHVHLYVVLFFLHKSRMVELVINLLPLHNMCEY